MISTRAGLVRLIDALLDPGPYADGYAANLRAIRRELAAPPAPHRTSCVCGLFRGYGNEAPCGHNLVYNGTEPCPCECHHEPQSAPPTPSRDAVRWLDELRGAISDLTVLPSEEAAVMEVIRRIKAEAVAEMQPPAVARDAVPWEHQDRAVYALDVLDREIQERLSPPTKADPGPSHDATAERLHTCAKCGIHTAATCNCPCAFCRRHPSPPRDTLAQSVGCKCEFGHDGSMNTQCVHEAAGPLREATAEAPAVLWVALDGLSGTDHHDAFITRAIGEAAVKRDDADRLVEYVPRAALDAARAELARVKREMRAANECTESADRCCDIAIRQRDAAEKRAEHWETDALRNEQNRVYWKERTELAEAERDAASKRVDAFAAEIGAAVKCAEQAEARIEASKMDHRRSLECWQRCLKDADTFARWSRLYHMRCRELRGALDTAADRLDELSRYVPVDSDVHDLAEAWADEAEAALGRGEGE